MMFERWIGCSGLAGLSDPQLDSPAARRSCLLPLPNAPTPRPAVIRLTWPGLMGCSVPRLSLWRTSPSVNP